MSTLEELQLNKGLYKITQSQFDEPVSSYEIGAERFTTGDIDGDLSFVGGFIQSKNFVTGSSGWRLDAEGNLEASDGTFRGTLSATSGTVGGFTIASTTLTGNNIILDSGNSKIKVTYGGSIELESQTLDTYIINIDTDNNFIFSADGLATGETNSIIFGKNASGNLRPDGFVVYTKEEIILESKTTTGTDREIYVNITPDEFRVRGSKDGVYSDVPILEINQERALLLYNLTSLPTAQGNRSGLYAKDVSSSSELFAFDEAGNTTQLSPHNPETKEWEFYSKNTKTGRVLKIKMEQLMKKLDEQYGGGFIEEYFDPVEEQLEETKL